MNVNFRYERKNFRYERKKKVNQKILKYNNGGIL